LQPESAAHRSVEHGAPLAGMRPWRCAWIAWIRCASCRAAGSHPSMKRLEPAPPSTRRRVARLGNMN